MSISGPIRQLRRVLPTPHCRPCCRCRHHHLNQSRPDHPNDDVDSTLLCPSPLVVAVALPTRHNPTARRGRGFTSRVTDFAARGELGIRWPSETRTYAANSVHTKAVFCTYHLIVWHGTHRPNRPPIRNISIRTGGTPNFN